MLGCPLVLSGIVLTLKSGTLHGRSVLSHTGILYDQITYIAVRPLCGHIGGNHLAGCRVEVHLLLGVLASVCNADVTEAAVSACSVPGTTDMHTLTFADFRPSSVQPGRRT